MPFANVGAPKIGPVVTSKLRITVPSDRLSSSKTPVAFPGKVSPTTSTSPITGIPGYTNPLLMCFHRTTPVPGSNATTWLGSPAGVCSPEP